MINNLLIKMKEYLKRKKIEYITIQYNICPLIFIYKSI